MGKYLIILFFSCAHAYQLTFVQTVSNSKKSFVTRNGHEEGISEGNDWTFTSDRSSVVARAMTVTHEYTQWLILEPHGLVPFHKDQIITMHPAPEHVKLFPRLPELKKLKKYAIDTRGFKHHTRHRVHLQMGQSSGFSQSVSNTEDNVNYRRLTHLSGGYHFGFVPGKFYLGGIARTDNEITDTPNALIKSIRSYFILDGQYHIPLNIDQSFNIITHLGIGFGTSSTEVGSEISTGTAVLLPAVGLAIEYYQRFIHLSLMGKIDVESHSVKESFDDGTVQSSQLSNIKVALEVAKYF